MEKDYWKFDCRHFDGYRPCKPYYLDRSTCDNCKGHYNPIKERILLIKLDALGDVLRTTPLAHALKTKYPESQLTWLTKDISYPLLKNNSDIDRLLIYKLDISNRLMLESFDMIINLDKNHDTAAITSLLRANKKFGYGVNEFGHLYPINEGAKYHFDVCLDDFGKGIKNEKTYQQMIFDTAEIHYNGEEYVFNLGVEEREFANKFAEKNLKSYVKTIGINPGSSPKYPHKRWVIDGYKELIKKIKNEFDVNILLYGGREEVDVNKLIRSGLEDKIIDTGNNNLLEFAALLNLSDIILTGDTSAMHLAIALKKEVIAFFGPTRSNEIDLYRRGKKLIGNVECLGCYEEFPCIKDQSGLPNCMQTIKVDEVYKSVVDLLRK